MTKAADETIHTINLVKQIEIAAPIEIAWEAVLEEMGPGSEMPDGKPFPLVIEARPGGRWYRDLGNDAGHFWGHVQVIKPPTLLEICGPMFMSYPVANHVQYRLTPEGGSVNGTRLTLTHRAFGQIAEDVRLGVNKGWTYHLEMTRKIAERLRDERRK